VAIHGPSLKKMSVTGLLQTHAAINSELRSRGILRSQNSPVGDYCEWLVAKKLKLTLATKSTSGYDATGTDGIRYQIKCRCINPDNKSRQLSAIRNLDGHDFDYLIGVLFDDKFKVVRAAKIPYAIIGQHAKFQKHTNSHILHLPDKLFGDAHVEDITESLRT
jgi:hypothetical protein